MVFDRKEYQKNYYRKNREKRKEQHKNYRQENKEKIKEYYNKYYQENKEKRKEYTKKNYQENKEKRKEQKKKHYQENKEKLKEYGKNYRQEIKELVYNHYGNGVIECACCREKEIDFLSLDHIYNNGGKHRKKTGGGYKIFTWAIQNNFPPIFQLLCMNCNFSKGKRGNNGKCIHQIRREEKEKRKQEENQP